MNDKLACSTLEMLDKMIEEVNKKPNITPAELDALKKAYELRMELQDCYGEDGESYGHYTMRGSYGHHDDMMDGSYMRGRSPVTGRYISRDGYQMSGHSLRDRMVAKLEEMYDGAATEYEREELRKEIRRIEAEK